jgi:adenylylsulfate kinase-like enzyme
VSVPAPDRGVWLVTGAQASGKSTIAELLARSFDRGVHVRGGQFYRWVVSGWIHFDDADQVEARRLLELRYRLSAQVADEYAAAGFTCVVQDNIYGQDVVRWLDGLQSSTRRLVVLDPPVDVVTARDAARVGSTGKVAYTNGFTPEENVAHVRSTPREVGLWIDTSAQLPEETVAEILDRHAEALVEVPPRA